MPTPLSTTGIASDAGAWNELEDVFAGLGQQARANVTPEQFYRTLLDESIRALSAYGGAVWLRAGGGAFEPRVHLRWPLATPGRLDQERRAHEELLANAASGERIVTIVPPTADVRAGDGPLGNHALVFAKVPATVDAAPSNIGAAHRPTVALAIIELLVPGDASPAAYRGCEQFLTAVTELAADFHAFDELRRLRRGDKFHEQLLQLSTQVHQRLNLAETAYTVANEGRRVVGCDRLSVLGIEGRRCQLLCTSGLGRIERRSLAARRLEELADLVRRVDEPAYYADGESDAMPPVAAVMEQHADESHARQIAAVPLRPADIVEAADSHDAHRPKTAPRFVLVAEMFDARNGEVGRERLLEVGQVCASALENAATMTRLPLGWLWRRLGAVRDAVTGHLSRTALVLAGIGAACAALVLVQSDFNIESTGTLEPVVRREVFAPRSGLVDEVLVEHGASVAAGQPLVQLRDPQLELEIKRVHGELETTQRQIDAVRATRTNRAIRETNPTDAYRLSAEERELDQRLKNLERERQLLDAERAKLVVTSPIDGSVMTWDVGHRLGSRPVDRGELLLTVADLSADWQLELAVPDDRIGHVLAAQESLQPELPVRFRLNSDDREQHPGHVAEVCQTADVTAEQGVSASPTVLVKVSLDDTQFSYAARKELRPGVAARAQITCGRRSLGYVWLHDVWDAILEWLRF